MTIIAKPTPDFVPDVNEPFARSLVDGVVLFIDGKGSWKVGQFGQAANQYVSVRNTDHASINDLTLGTTALSVASGPFVGTYRLYAVSNTDSSKYFEYTISRAGEITRSRELSAYELMGVEKQLGEDLNGNGGIANADVVVNDSSEKLMATPNGDLFIFKSIAQYVYLTVGGERLNLRDVGDLEFADVAFESDGSISAYLVSDDGDVYFQAFDAKGDAVGDLVLIEADEDATAVPVNNGVFGTATRFVVASTGLDGEGSASPLSSKIYNAAPAPGAGATAENRTGTDLNRKSDTPLTDGWTSMLKTPSLKAAIESGTANGAKLDHAGVINLINVAVAAAGGADKTLGDPIAADLRAIAARGKALFGAKNVNGSETSYLSYVFDKVVNDSDANAFFTGGKESKSNLGNLSAESLASHLVTLASKWLLGGDMPSPQVQGDTANASAQAGSGVYTAFSKVPLFVDGAQFSDVNQGNAGTCYLMATLAAFAHSYASDVQAVFVENANSASAGRTFGVRFFDLQGGEHWVTVNDKLVVPGEGQEAARYAQAKGVNAQGQVVPELWVALAEKAYAQFNELKINQRQKADNGFGAVEGGNAEINVFMFNRDAIQYVSDPNAAAPGGINGVTRMKDLPVPEGKTLLQVYTEALNAGRTLWIGSSIDIKDEAGKILFKGQHAHMVIDADTKDPSNTSVIAYNPWGVADANANHRTPFEYDLAKLVGVKGIDVYIDVPSTPGG